MTWLDNDFLPKQYPTEYRLHCEWGTYGKPEHFYTDGGKDFRSEHLRQIGVQLGFVSHLRDRPHRYNDRDSIPLTDTANPYRLLVIFSPQTS